MYLNQSAIKDLLPHRSPLLLVDEAWLEEKNAEASLYLSPDWDIFQGHFPDKPVLPGIYLTESMAQTADLVLLSLPGNAGKLPYFMGIRNMRFIRPVCPGATIKLCAGLLCDAGSGLYECTVSAFLAEPAPDDSERTPNDSESARDNSPDSHSGTRGCCAVSPGKKLAQGTISLALR